MNTCSWNEILFTACILTARPLLKPFPIFAQDIWGKCLLKLCIPYALTHNAHRPFRGT